MYFPSLSSVLDAKNAMISVWETNCLLIEVRGIKSLQISLLEVQNPTYLSICEKTDDYRSAWDKPKAYWSMCEKSNTYWSVLEVTGHEQEHDEKVCKAQNSVCSPHTSISSTHWRNTCVRKGHHHLHVQCMNKLGE